MGLQLQLYVRVLKTSEMLESKYGEYSFLKLYRYPE